MILRKATQKDFESICRLRRQLLHDPEYRLATEYAPYNEKNDRPWIQKCLRSRGRIAILIAQDGNDICAHSIVLIEKVPRKMQPYMTYRKKARLVHLYVAPGRRRQGIGESLLNTDSISSLTFTLLIFSAADFLSIFTSESRSLIIVFSRSISSTISCMKSL